MRSSFASSTMISQKAKYALRALIALSRAEKGHALVIGELAASEKIPKKFLEQILLDLKRHGILTSRRGKDGGYMMLKSPQEVTFGQVLRLVDGPVALLPCLSKIAYRHCKDCGDEATCEIRKVFAEVAVSTRKVLDGTSIADAITKNFLHKLA
jgi:Rrf2 family protein